MAKKFFLILAAFAPFSLQAEELIAQDFFVCRQKTATGVRSRTVKIHQFPEENKCAVIYSVKGKDQILSQGQWLSFCRRKAQKTVDNLKKGLWECNRQKNKSEVFYPSL